MIDLALLVLQLLMLKICGIIGISKIKFFNFCGTERVKMSLKDPTEFKRIKKIYIKMQFIFVYPNIKKLRISVEKMMISGEPKEFFSHD